jgi:hypothetical protein
VDLNHLRKTEFSALTEAIIDRELPLNNGDRNSNDSSELTPTSVPDDLNASSHASATTKGKTGSLKATNNKAPATGTVKTSKAVGKGKAGVEIKNSSSRRTSNKKILGVTASSKFVSSVKSGSGVLEDNDASVADGGDMDDDSSLKSDNASLGDEWDVDSDTERDHYLGKNKGVVPMVTDDRYTHDGRRESKDMSMSASGLLPMIKGVPVQKSEHPRRLSQPQNKITAGSTVQRDKSDSLYKLGGGDFTFGFEVRRGMPLDYEVEDCPLESTSIAAALDVHKRLKGVKKLVSNADSLETAQSIEGSIAGVMSEIVSAIKQVNGRVTNHPADSSNSDSVSASASASASGANHDSIGEEMDISLSTYLGVEGDRTDLIAQWDAAGRHLLATDMNNSSDDPPQPPPPSLPVDKKHKNGNSKSTTTTVSSGNRKKSKAGSHTKTLDLGEEKVHPAVGGVSPIAVLVGPIVEPPVASELKKPTDEASKLASALVLSELQARKQARKKTMRVSFNAGVSDSSEAATGSGDDS